LICQAYYVQVGKNALLFVAVAAGSFSWVHSISPNGFSRIITYDSNRIVASHHWLPVQNANSSFTFETDPLLNANKR
jgi:hypothetical protein